MNKRKKSIIQKNIMSIETTSKRRRRESLKEKMQMFKDSFFFLF